MNDYLKKVLLSRVYDVCVETELETAENLSRRLDNTVLLKREDTQPVFSFKLRGAYNKMAQLTREQLDRGVIAASAGNHAQGVALSARHLGCRATIVMPETSPAIKVRAVERLGGKVVLSGESFSDCAAKTKQLIEETGAVFIPPFDDEDVIAGQGTIAMEILRQNPGPLDAVFVPIGGGGLAAGVGVYIKQLRPEVKVIGVEPVDSDDMRRSIAAGRPVEMREVGLFADGVAVKLVGEKTFEICRDCLDDIVLVDTDAICSAIKDIFEDTRVVAEPAGALSLAGLKAYAAAHDWHGKRLACIVSGANMNFDRLGYVTDRAAIGSSREALIAVDVPEKIGSFRTLIHCIGNRNITEVCTRFSDPERGHVLLGLSLSAPEEKQVIIEDLRGQGFGVTDMSDNELAKLHIRHLVGGNAPWLKNEKLYRFVFPEHPGALLNFMDAMHMNFNITLFQYRYHGADFGRVLVGIDVPDGKEKLFNEFLDRVSEMGYPYVDETENEAYRIFLGYHG
ncbi:MAG: threonine ammonia-lyase, biosynthetic [Desulfovibrionaceae bacterium]|nr:threonine ammonia-lyase, biosynthetic [Desulfovibrionaceae bacterium]